MKPLRTASCFHEPRGLWPLGRVSLSPSLRHASSSSGNSGGAAQAVPYPYPDLNPTLSRQATVVELYEVLPQPLTPAGLLLGSGTNATSSSFQPTPLEVLNRV